MRGLVSSKVCTPRSIYSDGSKRILKGLPVSLLTSEIFKTSRYSPYLFITFSHLLSYFQESSLGALFYHKI